MKNGVHNCSGLNKKEALSYKNYLEILNGNILNGLTKLDLFSVRGISKKELKGLLYKESGINLNSENVNDKLLIRINKVYKETILKMKEKFFLQIPKGYEDKKWGNIDDFIDYILSTSKNEKEKKGYLRLIDCAIIKTMAAYNDILDNPIVTELEKNTAYVIKEIKKIPGFKVLSENIGINNGNMDFVYNSQDGSEPSYIKGRLTYRTKENAKILQKLLYNREYTKVDLIKDLIGVRIEVGSKEEGEKAIIIFSKYLFGENKTICDKGLLSEAFKENYNKKFVIKKGVKKEDDSNEKSKNDKITEKSKVSTADDFENASLKGEINNNLKGFQNHYKNAFNFEMQFVLAGNNNESSYNKHEIYDLKKMISIYSRLFGYCTIEDIKLLITEIGLLSGLPEEGIIKHLIMPSKKRNYGYLMKVTTDDQRVFYISSDVYNEGLKNEYGDFLSYQYLGNGKLEANKDITDFLKRYRKTKI